MFLTSLTLLLISAQTLISISNAILTPQSYDGWYNNRANPEWGAVGDEIIYEVPTAYSDLTYQPSGDDRPNPRVISNVVFSGPSGLPSWKNRTVLFAFFGQMVAYEVVHAADSSCPVEMIKVPVPDNDMDFSNSSGTSFMPFLRSEYNRKTGQAPNNPRRPVNRVSSWIDGSHIYGRGEVWSNCMRSFVAGQLTTMEDDDGFPGLNKIGLPMDSYPNPVTHSFTDHQKQWMMGDPHVHQNPGLAALAIVWFRYHNAIAKQLQAAHADWTDSRVFAETRKRVIATFQSIILYEWLPALLGEDLPEYTGYNPSLRPSIGAMFEAAAFRHGHSHVPPGLYVRDHKCNFKSTEGAPIRLCNSYWSSQDIIMKHGLEPLLMGMTSQIMEREDHVLVDDLRGKTFGPLHYSRHDLAVLTIMRGRDHGLPDYNTAREALGLPRVTEWEDINPWLYATDRQVIDNVRTIYGNLSKLDIYTAGMLEASPDGPGPLFRRVIRDQFIRIRNADRYWFENKRNGLFSDEEISKIRNTTLKDVLLTVTSIKDEEIQDDVFFWNEGDPCPQPTQLTADDLDTCTPHHGYDYFHGSEISYIVAFTCLGILPFVCILIAYMVARYKKYNEREFVRRLNEKQKAIESNHGEDMFIVQEWRGHKDTLGQVQLHIDTSTTSLVVNSGRKCLRSVNLRKYDNYSLWLSNDKWKEFLLLHVPREYDLVVKFPSETSRREFIAALTTYVEGHDKSIHVHELPQREVLAKAITKARRQELITQFFKNVFMEANTNDETKQPDELEVNQCKEIVECELSREEFAEALALKPDSLFVDQMFSVIDRDGNGYVSFREILNAVMLFAKGTSEDKLQLLFAMYDRDNSGTLDRQEVSEMISSMIEMANGKLCPGETSKLVHEMFVSAGMENSDSLQFADFTKIMSGQMHMMWDVRIDWKGTAVCYPKGKNRKKSETPKSPNRSSSLPNFADATVKNPLHPTRSAMRLRMIQHYLENHRQHFIYVFVYFSICALIFSERFYFFAVEQEHRGFRRIMGYGLSVTRGAAAVMSFSFSLLLLTMCRNTITRLRETVLNFYIPFDSNVAFHKMIAYTALVASMVHILGYCFNFYHITTQPVNFLCIIDEIFFRSDLSPKIHFWLFQNLTGITGVFLVVIICVMYVFASQTARIHIFNAFWITHQLFYGMYLLILLHGSARLVQKPYFPYYFMIPAILFTIDKMISLSKTKKPVSVVKAELLPSGITMLEFKRPITLEYHSGQWVRLACEELGSNEYHALTLTSAPHEENLAVHIRAIGPWTNNIRKVFDPENLTDKPYPKLYIDGPFGAGQQDWCRYDVSVLVGGGIGITPYASILKDFVFMTSVKTTFRIKCHKVYFVWVTGSQKHFEWLMDILKQVEEVDSKGIVETHIFITQFFQRFDLRTTMLYICEEHFQRMSGRSMFSGLKAKTHFGRPDFDKVLDAVRARHPKTRKIGVFSCGPPGLTKNVQRACYSTTKRCKARFEHHFENF